MSMIAMLGFMMGAFAASAWTIAASQFSPDTTEPQPARPETRTASKTATAPSRPAATGRPAPQASAPAMAAAAEKPLIARLQETDVVRTLGGILSLGGIPDAARMGWPTLRAGLPRTAFLDSMRTLRDAAARRSPANAIPVLAVIGAGAGEDRSIAALNIALAATRDGASVLLIDADRTAHAISNKVNGLGKNEPSRLGWLSIGSKASRAVKTANGISILPVVKGSDARAGEAIRKAIAQARAAGGYDLVILDGPAMPWSAADRRLFDVADGLVAVLPVHLDINKAIEDVITALGGAERKLTGVVLSEIHPPVVNRQRDKQYA
jgi:Mrp family chromosome partitioning ATPase